MGRIELLLFHIFESRHIIASIRCPIISTPDLFVEESPLFESLLQEFQTLTPVDIRVIETSRYATALATCNTIEIGDEIWKRGERLEEIGEKKE